MLFCGSCVNMIIKLNHVNEQAAQKIHLIKLTIVS